MLYKVYLYKRGIGLAREMFLSPDVAYVILESYKHHYDGIMVCGKDGTVKEMYGYCGI